MNFKLSITIILVMLGTLSFAQQKKVWVSGAARSMFQQNNLKSDGDSVTAKKLNSGHALVDLAINARPNKETYLHGMVRIRNDFGGFWGSGVSFDIRQLYLKGLVNESIRYQLGDINYKLTPYTFFSQNEELSSHQNEAFDIYQDVLRYDLFYNDDNTWRTQGATVDFALSFPKLVEEFEFSSFIFRNRPSDFAQRSERVFFGGNGTLFVDEKLSLGVNYIDLMDIKETSKSDALFHNPVLTGNVNFVQKLNETQLEFKSESGISDMYTLNDAESAHVRDYFYDLDVNVKLPNELPSISVNYINVGAEFRSVGAQTKRVNFESQNRMYTRYGNVQIPRPLTQLDLAQDASLFQINFNQDLDLYAPSYDNIQPYGKATPNRKGITFSADYSLPKGVFNVELVYQALSEVVGQGTESKRSFSNIKANGLLKIDTLMPNSHRDIELSFGFNQQRTERSTSLAEGNIDLSGTIADIGLKVGIVEDLNLLCNYRMINSSGNELVPVRNSYSEVIDYTPFQTEMKQNILLFALRYAFSQNNHLNIIWQNVSYDDASNSSPKFDISQFGIVYSMNF